MPGTDPANDQPVVNVHALRRDIYRLIVLLFADEKVAEVEAFRTLADSGRLHESEVNRLLVWIAVASRQLLDIDGHSTGDDVCGRHWHDYPGGNEAALTFRRACNAAIHASEIVPYEVGASDEASPSDGSRRACYNGTITIRGRPQESRRDRHGKSSGSRGRTSTRAVVDFKRFIECCERLSSHYMKD